jgi:hypothetical protein
VGDGLGPNSCVFDVEFTPGIPSDAAGQVCILLLGHIRRLRTVFRLGSVMNFMDQLHITDLRRRHYYMQHVTIAGASIAANRGATGYNYRANNELDPALDFGARGAEADVASHL